jgi:uncharacterized protein YjiS (DUF1127 family)
MRNRSLLSLTATIPPGETAHLSTKLCTPFRPERLLISSQSFPLSLARRLWTWLPVTIGNSLGRVHRGLAKLLRIDLYATRKRREYVSLEYARVHPEEIVTWHKSEEPEDKVEDRPFILIPTPLNRRERLLTPLGRAARYLTQLRLRWQLTQLSTLLVQNITISRQSQIVEGRAPLPGDMFATLLVTTIDVNLNTCQAGHEINIEVHNGNRRECRLVMAFFGASPKVQHAA